MPAAPSRIRAHWYFLLALLLFSMIAIYGTVRHQQIRAQGQGITRISNEKTVLLINMRAALMKRFEELGDMGIAMKGTVVNRNPGNLADYEENLGKLSKLLTQQQGGNTDELVLLSKMNAAAQASAPALAKLEELHRVANGEEATRLLTMDLEKRPMSEQDKARMNQIFDLTAEIGQRANRDLRSGAGEKWLDAINQMISLETELETRVASGISDELLRLRKQILVSCAGATLLLVLGLWSKFGNRTAKA